MGARPIHETILIAKQTGDRLRDNKELRHFALASLYKSGQLTYKRKLFFIGWSTIGQLILKYILDIFLKVFISIIIHLKLLQNV